MNNLPGEVKKCHLLPGSLERLEALLILQEQKTSHRTGRMRVAFSLRALYSMFDVPCSMFDVRFSKGIEDRRTLGG
jgi:hypothetical protein